MKLSFGIFCTLAIAFLSGCCDAGTIDPPRELFADAINYQMSINDKQSVVFQTIANMRIQLGDILKNIANNTLVDIESDINQILSIDLPYRDRLYADNVAATPCVNNLRTRLNHETEFTGFQAGLCLETFDKEVSGVTNEAFEVVKIFDNELSQYEMSIVESFILKNVFTQSDSIREQYTNSYDKFIEVLDTLGDKISEVATNVEQIVGESRQQLQSCYEFNQNELATYLKRFEAQMGTCISFDK